MPWLTFPSLSLSPKFQLEARHRLRPRSRLLWQPSGQTLHGLSRLAIRGRTGQEAEEDDVRLEFATIDLRRAGRWPTLIQSNLESASISCLNLAVENQCFVPTIVYECGQAVNCKFGGKNTWNIDVPYPQSTLVNGGKKHARRYEMFGSHHRI